jgi:hypothetical protein
MPAAARLAVEEPQIADDLSPVIEKRALDRVANIIR